ncbi:MAG: 50S ribosomal protein L22 [Patescibacteria group bacterium]
MEAVAIAKNIRISPQKIRLVVAQIKKMKPAKAIEILDFVPNKPSMPLKKAIMSAIANAKNNFELDENSLTFQEINVTKGIVFKRYRPVSRGRAHSIKKQTSNIRIVLSGEKQKKETNPLEDKKENQKEVSGGTKS